MLGAAPASRKVFISYSHDSEAHKTRVLALADRLRRDGIDCSLDQYELAPREGWPTWTLRSIEEADLVLVVCSETYARRFGGREKLATGLGATWEGGIIRQEMYDESGEKFVPVVFSADDQVYIPAVLHGQSHFVLDSDPGYRELYRRLTAQPEAAKPALGLLLSLTPRPAQSFQDHQAGSGIETSGRRLVVPLALVAALVAVLSAALYFAKDWKPDPVRIPPPPKPLITAVCATEMPLALHYNIDTVHRPDFYWLKVQMKNPGPDRKTLVVQCEVKSTPRPFECNRAVGSQSIEPSSNQLTRWFTPSLEPARDRLNEEDAKVLIQWEIRDDLDKVLDHQLCPVWVAPRNIFYWRLKTPEGGELSRDFLLASLSAWVRIAPALVPRQVREVRFRSPEEFLEQAYARLFSGNRESAMVELTPDMLAFPPSLRMKILTPEEVLTAKLANPLEAALLLAAVAAERLEQAGVQLALVTTTQPAERRVYLAWYRAVGGPWQAIAPTAPGSFRENLTRSSREVRALIPHEAIAKLAEEGVYLGEMGRLAVLDFATAKERFKIQGLP